MLEELQKDAETEAIEKLVIAHLEHITQLSSTLACLLEGVLDSGKLSLNLQRVSRKSSEGGDDVASLLRVALENEPTGTFGESVDRGHDDNGENDAEGDGRAPRNGAVLELEEGQVNP